jgi:hypothetical protein
LEVLAHHCLPLVVDGDVEELKLTSITLRSMLLSHVSNDEIVDIVCII